MDKIQQCEILEKLIHILSMDKHDFFSSPTSLLDRFINLNLAFFMKSSLCSFNAHNLVGFTFHHLAETDLSSKFL